MAADRLCVPVVSRASEAAAACAQHEHVSTTRGSHREMLMAMATKCTTPPPVGQSILVCKKKQIIRQQI